MAGFLTVKVLPTAVIRTCALAGLRKGSSEPQQPRQLRRRRACLGICAVVIPGAKSNAKIGTLGISCEHACIKTRSPLPTTTHYSKEKLYLLVARPMQRLNLRQAAFSLLNADCEISSSLKPRLLIYNQARSTNLED